MTVDAPPEHAFAVFTSDLASWWPLHSHHIGSQPAVAVVVEHRGLEAYGDRAQQMRNVFGSPDGWAGLLKRFAGTTAER